MHSHLRLAICLGALALPLAACNETGSVGSAEQTYGPSPQLPSPQTSWIPTVNIATAKGWPEGGKPTAANGMAVNAFASGLEHPRTVYVLPNGDVLVAETNAPPKPDDGKGIKGFFMQVGDEAGPAPACRARTASRCCATPMATASPKPAASSSSGLNSPFGMVLVGEDFYVANTDAIMKFPYQSRRHQNHRSRARSSRTCPRAPSIITGPRTSPPAPTDRSSMPPSAPTATSPRTASRPRRIAPPYWKSIAPAAHGACLPRACAIRTDRMGAADRRTLGRRQRARRTRQRSGA